jgi:hypothetical protein
MIASRAFQIILLCLLAADSMFAAGGSNLKLLPAPREVEIQDGRLVIKPSIDILISRPEDRFAAETLRDEIVERGGSKVAIESVSSSPKVDIHVLIGRLSDRNITKYLETAKIKPDGLGDQGYVVHVTAHGVLVAANTAQGVFYGVQTLRQLIRSEGKSFVIPALIIRDWPSMEWRGVSDDISRGPIPTLDYLKKQIRMLAEYKINLLGLNMENVFAFKTQLLVPPGDAALTVDEIRELVAYASKYFITLLPEQQTFGHMHQFLKYEVYSDVAETPHGHVLTPTNPKTYDFTRQIYGEIVPLFPGAFFHIGGDETFELGTGQTKALAAQEGLGRVYLDHLQKLSALMQPYHKQLMFWGDIALKYPELISTLPKDMIAVPWDYDLKPSYESEIIPFRQAGLRVVVAPGASNWGQIWPDFDTAFANIHNFVRDGQKNGAIGVLTTNWNDDGESLLDMTWPALVYGASASWQAGETSADDFLGSYDWAFYRSEESIFQDVIANLDRPRAFLNSAKLEDVGNNLFWVDPFSQAESTRLKSALPVTHELRLGAEHAIESILENRSKARIHADTLDDMEFAGWRLDFLGMKMQFVSEINGFYWDAYQNQADATRVQHDFDEIYDINGRLQSLRDQTTRLRRMYEAAWARENRHWWIDNVLARYDNLASEFQAKIEAVRQANRQYDKTKSMPTPDSLGFYLQPQ